MIFNATLQDLSFKSFLNLPEEFLFGWTLINFSKCLYVAVSITNECLPPIAVAAILVGLAVFYFAKHAFSWLWVLCLLNLSSIVYTVLTKRDGIFLLTLLSFAIYYLKPFDCIVDVFVALFLMIDIPVAIITNPPLWSFLYLDSLCASVALAIHNSRGFQLHSFFLNSFFVCLFWGVTSGAASRSRLIPVCAMITVFVIGQLERKEPISLSFSSLDLGIVSQSPTEIVDF